MRSMIVVVMNIMIVMMIVLVAVHRSVDVISGMLV